MFLSENPVNLAPASTRPDFYVQMVAVVTGFHCNNNDDNTNTNTTNNNINHDDDDDDVKTMIMVM